MEAVKLRSESYKEWLSAVKDVVENKASKKKGAVKPFISRYSVILQPSPQYSVASLLLPHQVWRNFTA